MADEVEIVKLLKQGHSRKDLARRNGIWAATISDIKNNSCLFLY
jgi:uncharacterized protein YerC